MKISIISTLSISLLLSVCQSYAMQSSATKNLALVVKPSVGYLLSKNCNGQKAYAMITTLTGISSELDKIQMSFTRSGGDELDDSVIKIVEDHTNQALSQSNCITNYPLKLHKKLCSLRERKELSVIVEDEKDNKRELLLGKSIKKRLFHYLLCDATEQKRNSFNLCKKVVLQKAQPGEQINQYGSLMEYIDLVGTEKDIDAGDMIGLGTVSQLDECSRLLQFHYYAVALGDNMYLSKLDYGGPLFVTNGNYLLNLSHDLVMFKIDPSIGKRADFVADPFRAISSRLVSLLICPYDEMVTFANGKKVLQVAAFIKGMRCTNNQVALRSDCSLSGTIDGHDFSSVQEYSDYLSQGVIGQYPLSIHKQLHSVVGDEMFCLGISTQEGVINNIVDWSCDTKRRFFAYLLCDSQDTKRSSFDFCKEVCLNRYNANQLIFKSTSYSDLYHRVKEKKIEGGDVIAMGKGRKIKHFTVALGNNFYVSTLGYGSALAVTSLQSLLDVFKCAGFVVIKPTITRYQKFLDDCKGDFKRTDIKFWSRKKRK